MRLGGKKGETAGEVTPASTAGSLAANRANQKRGEGSDSSQQRRKIRLLRKIKQGDSERKKKGKKKKRTRGGRPKNQAEGGSLLGPGDE